MAAPVSFEKRERSKTVHDQSARRRAMAEERPEMPAPMMAARGREFWVGWEWETAGDWE